MDEGGDAVCWLDRACPDCGFLEDGPLPDICPRCGRDLRGDRTAGDHMVKEPREDADTRRKRGR